MPNQTLTGNAQIVADYLDAVFNRKDLAVAETYWAGNMIQSNDAQSMAYERGIIMQNGDYVMVHGRYSGWAGKTMIAVDIFRLENGKVVEHWDVMQEEVLPENSANGNAMFPVL